MKLRFLKQSDTALAGPETSVIDQLKAELLQRPGVTEAADLDSADAIILHEPWAFRERRYVERLLADPIMKRHAQKVYTVNNDDAATGLLRGIYSCLPRSRFDPALHAAVPFLAQPNEFVLQQAGTPRPAPTHLATWRGNPKSNRKLRERLLQVCGRSGAFQVESTQSWLNHGTDEKRHYVELLRAGKFALCPGGWAAASMRIYESMALGVAPAIIADDFVAPEGIDWSAVSLRIREADLDSLELILNRAVDDHEAMGRRAGDAWQRSFSPDRLMAFYADALLGCIRSSAGTGSAEQEVRRWRSRRMYRTNQWTLPQRVLNKLKRMLNRKAALR
jgi:hypothetical protein